MAPQGDGMAKQGTERNSYGEARRGAALQRQSLAERRKATAWPGTATPCVATA